MNEIGSFTGNNFLSGPAAELLKNPYGGQDQEELGNTALPLLPKLCLPSSFKLPSLADHWPAAEQQSEDSSFCSSSIASSTYKWPTWTVNSLPMPNLVARTFYLFKV